MTSCRPCDRRPRLPNARAILAVLALLAVPLLPSLVVGCGEGPKYGRVVADDEAPQAGLPTAEIEAAGRTLVAELCLDGPSRARGMKFRTEFPDDRAMLFVFPLDERGAKRFWMRDTLIELDILFLEDDGTVINVHENCPPAVEQPGFSSDRACTLVLELRGGWCAEYGLGPGDRVTLPDGLFDRALPTNP